MLPVSSGALRIDPGGTKEIRLMDAASEGELVVEH
jgi:hypothetical protein